jgi:hypothetical protein
MELTALGRKFYKNKQEEYIVEIPVIISTTDSKGRTRVRRGEHLPVVELSVGRIFASQGMSEPQKIAAIKQNVLL